MFWWGFLIGFVFAFVFEMAVFFGIGIYLLIKDLRKSDFNFLQRRNSYFLSRGNGNADN